MKTLLTCGLIALTSLLTDPCALMASGYVEGKVEQFQMEYGLTLPCNVQEALYQNYLGTCQGNQQ
jgi:hypothetical protein